VIYDGMPSDLNRSQGDETSKMVFFSISEFILPHLQ